MKPFAELKIGEEFNPRLGFFSRMKKVSSISAIFTVIQGAKATSQIPIQIEPQKQVELS